MGHVGLDVDEMASTDSSWEGDCEIGVGDTFLSKVASNLNAKGATGNLLFPVEVEPSNKLPPNCARELSTV